jgi:hypothetical protein
MKKILRTGLFLFLGLLGASSFTLFPALGAGDDSTVDLTRTVEVSAAPGVLKSHARNATQYRNLNSGTQSLTSGSFLKTENGSADILLPNDTLLSLDANTEVQVGMYENGIIISQKNGRAYHCVETSQNWSHSVKTALYTATALGTEYRTIFNWPRNGEVTVEWGNVGIDTHVTQTDSNGQIVGDYWEWGFVPMGSKVVAGIRPGPPDRLGASEHEKFHADARTPGRVVIVKTNPPSDDSWTRRTRETGRLLRNLRERLRRGTLTPAQYSQKIREMLGLGPGSMPGRPEPPMGGLWIGNAGDIFTMRFCRTGSSLADFQIVDEWQGQDKQTHEVYMQRVNFSMPGTIFMIERDGRVDGVYTISDPDSIWRGATIQARGFISGRTGRLFISVTSETDVAIYLGICMEVAVRLVDPNGCNY